MSQRKSRKTPFTNTLHKFASLKSYYTNKLKTESLPNKINKYNKKLHDMEYKKFIMKLTKHDINKITKLFEYMELEPFDQQKMLDVWHIKPDTID